MRPRIWRSIETESLAGLGKGRLDRGPKPVFAELSVWNVVAVNHDRGRSFDADRFRIHRVGSDPGAAFRALEIFLKFIKIQAELFGLIHENRAGYGRFPPHPLGSVKSFGHLPKTALVRSCLRSACGNRRVLVRI